MRAAVGDRISTRGRHVGDPTRSGVVTEVRGTADTTLYVVRWDDGHEAICYPGPETKVEHRVEHPAGG